MERLEVLLDVRLPSVSKPTISLFFGLLISLVSVLLLLTAMCSQTWAVRQETVMLQQINRVASHSSGTVKSSSSDSQDADSRVQIKVPVEVPSLQVMLERNKEAAPQFYEGRLNELYTERLNELTREAQSQGKPQSSPLSYKPSVKLKTKRDNQSSSIQSATGILASLDEGNRKIKVSARDAVPPNEGDNTTANEARVRISDVIKRADRLSIDLNFGRNLYSAGAVDLKDGTLQFRKSSSTQKFGAIKSPEIEDFEIYNSKDVRKYKNYFNESQSLRSRRVIRSYRTFQQHLNSSREEFINFNPLPIPYIKFLNVLKNCIQLCNIENKKLKYVLSKFKIDATSSKMHRTISYNKCKSLVFQLNFLDFLPSSPEFLFKLSENHSRDSLFKEKQAQISSEKLRIFNFLFRCRSPSKAVRKPKNEKEKKRAFDSQATAQTQTTDNNPLPRNGTAPLQQQQQKTFEQKSLTVTDVERQRRPLLEEIVRLHGGNRRSTGRSPETENLPSSVEGLLGTGSGQTRLKTAPIETGMKSYPAFHAELPLKTNKSRSLKGLLKRRDRRSSDVAVREPTDLKYRVCLWRVCITATRQLGNTTTLCWSVLGSSAADSEGSSPPHSSSPTALITSLRYASAAVVAATAMLCLAASIALRAFILERHTHNLNCHNTAAPASSLPAAPGTGPTTDPTMVIKSPSLNSTSSAQLRNFHFKSTNDASAQSADEASSSATEVSGQWFAGQQQDQFLLPVASALFAVSGITMGGGVFKFCSAMTEKSITSPNDGGHFSSMSSHLSTTLHWPLLLAANCVVGCFLSALAIGYTFFLTWDKQILNFLNTGTSNDNLIMDQNYDRAASDRKSLCDRCKAKSTTIIEEVTKSLEDNSLAPYQCCQVEYCCNNPTIRHHKSHCNPHSHDAQFSHSLRKQPCMKTAHSYHYPSRCNQCMKSRDVQFAGSSRIPASSPRISNNVYDSKFEDTRAKFWSTELHASYNHHLHQNLDRYRSHPNDRHHNEEFFPLPIDSALIQKVANETERQVIKVCDDPICQREQLRFQRSQSVAEGRQPFRSNLQLNRPKELVKYNDNIAANVRWKPFDKKEVFSDGEVEHMYSNFIVPNNAHSFAFPHYTEDRFRIDNKAASCSTHCACGQCSADVTMGGDQGEWSRSYIHASQKERKSRPYSVDIEKSTASAFQSPHQSLTSLRNTNYSTLPAKFSTKDSFFFQDGRSNHASREFKSCLNITETSVSSFDLIKNNIGQRNGDPKQNSSAPSLKAKIDEFDKRKLVKTVKFITPDDDDSDSDSDYYVKKPIQNSIKKTRRDFLAADGSSPIRELCGNSPLYR